MPTDDEQHAERIRQGFASMTAERRAAILGVSIYHAFYDRLRSSWSVMGENGVVSMEHPSEADAENYIIEGTGVFDE